MPAEHARELMRPYLVIRGTAAPNSVVRLKIDYVNRLFGVLGLRGTAAQVDLPVAKDGTWTSKPLDISSLLSSRGTEYTITAVAISQNEERSPTATLKLTGK